MEFFPDQARVRLRNRKHGTYLYANEDGVYVSLKPDRASLNTAWLVHRILRDDGGGHHVLLHSAAYGRYLALSPETAPIYDGHQAHLAVQGAYEAPLQQDVLWEAVKVEDGSDDVFMLHASNRLLRASPRNTLFYGHAFVDTDTEGNTMQWVVEHIPTLEEPPVLPSRQPDERQ